MTEDEPQVQRIPENTDDIMDRSWHVPFLGALVTFFSSSLYRLSGLLFVEIMEEFSVNREQASWPVNMMSSGYDMGGLLYGLLSQCLSLLQTAFIGALLTSLGVITSVFVSNIWWMTFTLGLVHGLGSGTIAVCVQVFVSQHFAVYRGIAHGIVYTGAGVSTFVLPSLILLLIRVYNLKGTIFLLGGLLLNLIPLCAFFSHPLTIARAEFHVIDICDNLNDSADALHREAKQYGTLGKPAFKSPESKPKLMRMVAELLRTSIFYVLFLSWLAMYLNLDLITTPIVDFSKDIGISEPKAATLLSYFSITDVLGRLLIPLIADKNLLRRSALSTISLLSAGILVAALASVKSHAMLVVVVLAMAAAMGCSLSMFAVLLADYLGLERLSAGYGLCSVIGTPILLLKPLIIGE
ncbi:monocarboxylate transporter, putative [Ixodes scapularis]|uniref:Monocarboxylate transporter, putative n=1 Tax=Ixodes scapularis TaxID=6945 RepID=B7P5T7_IXOSC|nr:monocarboxylate transporter, putative [Ixodes scapularis]|eukprot:XP_002407874.1 monocarboxylate transporter, putative [Ixodes scapularis]